MAKKLTAKQQRFVEEYLVDLNATQAAIRAGYSRRSARQTGADNMAKAYIADAIQVVLDARSERTEVTSDRVLAELARIGFADVRDLFEWDEERTAFVPSRNLTADQAAAVASVKSETTRFVHDDGTTETKIKLELKTHDKIGALREIGKHLGVAQRHELTGKDGGPIETRELSDEELIERAKLSTNRVAALSPNGQRNGKH